MQKQVDFSQYTTVNANAPQWRNSEWIYWRIRVSSQRQILESVTVFKNNVRKGTGGGSSFLPRLPYSSLMPNSKQSSDL